jgi:anaphase-promoting complex subunit 3
MFNEDFAKAKKCFENALHIDIRHYQAWWGLGNIFYKQEKYDKAYEHFHKAININNPVLYSFMGLTLLAKREYSEALK